MKEYLEKLYVEMSSFLKNVGKYDDPGWTYEDDYVLEKAQDFYEALDRLMETGNSSLLPPPESFAALLERYPEGRDEMTEWREKAFIDDTFSVCEASGFRKKFRDGGGDFADYKDCPFTVIRRASPDDANPMLRVDKECLPMWVIEFPGGRRVTAYPEEIINGFA